ncbi:MAG: Ig-like domain-containing protein [Phycisphaerae bacterium]|nr:Ig-like domain-containing protein [Gemmatimonadaceae bacterium]
MALSSRTVAVSSLLALIGVLGACDGFKKTKDACSVTVAPRELFVPVNGTTSVIGTAFDCDGNSIANKVIKFNSSNSAIASVTPAGQIIGIAVGTATVSAVANGKSGEASVTVTPERVQTVTLAPATATLRRNQQLQLTPTAKNVLGNVIPGITFQWASSNSSLGSVDNNGKVTAIAPGTINITATADGQVGTALITITEVPIGSCTLSPTTQRVTVSNQVQPTLALKDTAGMPLSTTGRVVNWSSDNNIVATVTQTGVVTAVRAGTARITAADQQNSAINCSTSVEVVDARIVTARINPVNALLRIGAPRQFTLTLSDSNGTTISQVGRTVTWKNVTPGIATVTTAGVVQGVALGTGRVAIDAEGTVDTVSFTVSKIPVSSVTLTPLQRTVVEGQTAQFTATVRDTADNVVTDRVFEWTSSDVNRGTVSNTGLVTTTAPGSITITANVEGRQGQATLIITPVPVDTILIVQPTLSLERNTNSSFSIQLKDAAGRELRNRTVIVTSDQPSVAVGTANAQSTQVNVTGLIAGTANLTIQAVNANNQNEGKPSKVAITVTLPP